MDLRNNNCEDDKNELLENLLSFLEESDASLNIHPQIMGVQQMVLFLFMLQSKVQHELRNCDMKILSLELVSGFIAKRVLRGINCDECTICLTSPIMMATNVLELQSA